MRKAIVVGVAALALVAGAACTPGNNFRDVEGVDSKDADKYVVYNNVDRHPNLVLVCISGTAFITTTREFNAVTRVPDLDKTCPPGK